MRKELSALKRKVTSAVAARTKVAALVILLILTPSAIIIAVPRLASTIESALTTSSLPTSIGYYKGTFALQEGKFLPQVASPSAPTFPYALAFDPKNNMIYVADAGFGTVVCPYSAATGQPVPECRVWDEVSVVSASTGMLVGSINTTVSNCFSDCFGISTGYTTSPLSYSMDSVTVDTNNGYVFAADQNGSIIAINGTTNSVVKVIPSPSQSIYSSPTDAAVAFDSQNGYLYVDYVSLGHVLVYDPNTLSIVKSINISSWPTVDVNAYPPSAITVNQATGNVYLFSANGTSAAYDGSSYFMYIISGSSNTILANETIPINAPPSAIAVNQLNGDIYFGSDNFRLLILNGTTFGVLGNFTNSVSPLKIAVNQTNGVAYFVSGDSIYMIKGNSYSLVKSFSFVVSGNPTFGLVIDPAQDSLYWSSFAGGGTNTGGLVGSLNEETNQTIGVTSIDFSPNSGVFDPVNDAYYARDYAPNALSVVNTSTDTLVSTIPLGTDFGGEGNPQTSSWHGGGITVNPSNGEVYVADSPANTSSTYGNCTLLTIDPNTNKVIGNVSVADPYTNGFYEGCYATDVVFDSENNLIYVSSEIGSYGSGQVSVLNASSDKVLTTISSSNGLYLNFPASLALDPLNNFIYVSEGGLTYTSSGYSGYVSLINGTSNTLVGQTTLNSRYAPASIVFVHDAQAEGGGPRVRIDRHIRRDDRNPVC